MNAQPSVAYLKVATAKPAGVRCVQLDAADRCRIFGQAERPAVCGSLRPTQSLCRGSREEALQALAWLEAHTAPG